MNRRFEYFLYVFTRFNFDGFDFGFFVVNDYFFLFFTFNEN